jgi:hypothetical protein
MKQSPYEPPREITPPTVANEQTAAPVAKLAHQMLGMLSLVSAVAFVVWAILLSSGMQRFVLVVLGLIASPYLMLWIACRSLKSWTGTVLIALTLAACIWLGVHSFSAVDDDAQGALNLVLAPIYQLGGTAVSMCVAVLLDWAERKLAKR